MSTEEKEWIIPASIPFDELKGRDLEECVYWLLDAMGAQELEWRVGGTGGGASDGGRDLEAKILVPCEGDELMPQIWWFECKGRKGTVEAEAVKNAATNGLAYKQVDSIVVVTNTRFSNPTTDWVKSWNESHKKPRIQLWDRSHLERLISRQPSVVLRLFANSLSLQGRLEALQSRFWSRLEYMPVKVLEDIWQNKDQIDIDPTGRFALIANEFAIRRIAHRSWGAIATNEQLYETLQITFLNLPYLYLRAVRSGANQEPIFQAIVYLILLMLQYITAENMAKIMEKFINGHDNISFPEDVISFLIEPILNNLLAELIDVCVPECCRVSRISRQSYIEDGDSRENYWTRFDSDFSEIKDKEILWIEGFAQPCDVGFHVDEKQGCPLISIEAKAANLLEILTVAKRISSSRLAKSREKRRN